MHPHPFQPYISALYICIDLNKTNHLYIGIGIAIGRNPRGHTGVNICYWHFADIQFSNIGGKIGALYAFFKTTSVLVRWRMPYAVI